MSSPIKYSRYSGLMSAPPGPVDAQSRDLQIRKMFQDLMKDVALQVNKGAQNRNQSMKLKAKKGRKNYRG